MNTQAHTDAIRHFAGIGDTTMKQNRAPDRKYIINLTMGGTFFIEGEARVLKTIDARNHRYLVDFGDGQRVERFVDPAAQTDPAKYVAGLNDA